MASQNTIRPSNLLVASFTRVYFHHSASVASSNSILIASLNFILRFWDWKYNIFSHPYTELNIDNLLLFNSKYGESISYLKVINYTTAKQLPGKWRREGNTSWSGNKVFLQVGARLKSLGVEYLLTFHRRRLLFPVSLYSSYEQQERHKLGVQTSKFTVTILSDYNS